MERKRLNVGELATAAGLSRRAIRFYVQRGLLRPPYGRGRGRHYDEKHLEDAHRIRELQGTGHSLDAIAKIMKGGSIPAATLDGKGAGKPRRRQTLTSQLWTRLTIADGVELHLDATKHNPDVKSLVLIQETIKELLG